MNNLDKNKDLLLRFIYNQVDEQESDQAFELIQSDEQCRDYYFEMKPLAEALWTYQEQEKNPELELKRSTSMIQRYKFAIAASLIGLMVGAYFFTRVPEKATNLQSAYTLYQAKQKSDKKNFAGVDMYLNSLSAISYNASQDTFNLVKEGSEVCINTNGKKICIFEPDSKTCVRNHGTVFFMQKTSDSVMVFVKTGKVVFEKINKSDSVLLGDNQIGVYDLKTDKFKTIYSNQNAKLLAWVDNKTISELNYSNLAVEKVEVEKIETKKVEPVAEKEVVKEVKKDVLIQRLTTTIEFEKTTLRNVCDTLQSRFHITITIPANLQDRKITCTLQDKELNQLLKIICSRTKTNWGKVNEREIKIYE